jgi:hypothetical protein
MGCFEICAFFFKKKGALEQFSSVFHGEMNVADGGKIIVKI